MVRISIIALLGLAVLTASPARAQNGAPESDARFNFHKIDNGFLKLDSRTGQVSLCQHKSIGWACETVPDERAALESEIDRLQRNNAALKKEMLARGLTLPDPERAVPPQSRNDGSDLKLPSQADVDRVMTFVEKVWRRLIEVMGNIQKDMLGRT